MNKKDQSVQEAQVVEENALVAQEPQSLDKPANDTAFAQKAADLLVDIIRKNNWSRKLGGQSEHISYEGWQTAGKYYGHSVKTHDAEYVELGGTWGFKAKATVVNENTGIEIGSAEAYCMSDENNWRNKPKFQLASMAQTRAGSKALRQNLGFVIALAGYNTTPAEEMDGVHDSLTSADSHVKSTVKSQIYEDMKRVENEKVAIHPLKITEDQKLKIRELQAKTGKTQKYMEQVYSKMGVEYLKDLSYKNAANLIIKMEKSLKEEPTVLDQEPEELAIDMDEADREIAKAEFSGHKGGESKLADGKIWCPKHPTIAYDPIKYTRCYRCAMLNK